MKTFVNLTVLGRDKSGAIARITSFLFQHGGNIEALEENVTRGRFSMHLLASWPSSRFTPDPIRSGIHKLGAELDMEVTFKIRDPRRRQRFALFVTRETHCLQSLLQAARRGRIPAQPALILGNRADLKPLAEQAGVPFALVPWNQRDRAEARALRLLDRHDIDFIVLARFMKILSPNFVWRFKNRILNIHPSLLPSFPGAQAYRQAYEAGVKIVGVTAHFVTMHLDEGPIIAQGSFHVPAGMRLKDIVERGQRLEASVLLRAVRLFLTRKLDVYWGRVREV